MIEIIILIFLTRDIGKMAAARGLRPSTWKIYLVAGWIVAELTGVIIGILIFGTGNIISAGLLGLGFAVTSYYGLRSVLNKYPHAYEDDINNIGNG